MMTMTEKDTQTRHARPGFSLIEIMIAITILGLVMAVAVPAVTTALKKAQKRTTVASLKSFKNGIAEYQREVHQWPTKLKDLIKKPANVTGWDGPYIGEEGIAEVPRDSWGADFKYKITQGAKHPYELYSWGPNGQGSPKDEWISVWEEAKKE